MSAELKAMRDSARAMHQAGKLVEAQALYAQFLAKVPDDDVIWSNLGVLLRATGRHAQALRAHRRAYAIKPNAQGVQNNLANVLSDIGQYDESIKIRQQILETDPAALNHHAMIGRCLRGKGDYAAAIDYLDSQLKTYPDDTELKMQLSFAQLGAGDYATGFETYQIRWEAGELKPRDLPFAEWKGEPLAGKIVLVLPEQGFGDAVLFARFVKTLKSRGAIVHFLAEKPMVRLFDGMEGVDWIGTQVSKSVDVDFWINSMDLALLHFEDSDTAVPPPVRLKTPPAAKERAQVITAPYRDVKKIGVVWTGSATYKGNAFRSFRHADFLPLTEIEGVQLFSLYKGPYLAPYEADGTSAFIVNAGASEADFADCAAMMQEMDLVITSDTATAHVAGSLGVPTWTILHWDPFWVWRHSGNTTEWYPDMRLFRQQTPLQWDAVMAEVACELKSWTESSS